MNEQEFKTLVDKYIAGTCTPAEKQLLERIDAGFDEAPEVLLSVAEQEATGARLFQVIETNKQRTVTTRLWWGRISAAAVLAAMLLAGWWLYTQQAPVPQSATYATIITATGEQKTVQLPDGSVVVLNAGSTLRFPRSFEGDTRTVSLQGEAFFTIQQKAGQPFMVQAGGLTTTVLGTSFNMNAYAHRAAITVSLATGKVQVKDSTVVLGTLLPGNELVYNNNTKTGVLQAVAVPEIAAWQSGTLIFKQASLEEVAFTLKNRYGIHISFENAAAARCRITSRFQRNVTLREVLDIITGLNKMQYTLQGNTARISGKGCSDF
jgi:ferric-dicitrate binding protein FerR (iron transport regulator)